MQSLTLDRRRARLRQRQQIRRRRVVALAAFVTLVSLAVWAASVSVTNSTPANIPNTSPLAANGAQGSSDRVAVASVRGVELLLPVQKQYTTAIAYHSVDNRNALALSPYGDRQSGGGIAASLADVFKSGGGVRYYLMGGDGASSATAGLDVGAAPGSYIYSPIDGHVAGVKTYSLLGRYTDQEVDIRFVSDPSLLLVVTHMKGVLIKIGDQVRAGETQLGYLRAFPARVKQDLKQFTSDAGDHVQIMVLHVPVSISGF